MPGMYDKLRKFWSDRDFDKKVASLPTLASRDANAAVDLFKTLTDQAASDPARLAHIFETVLPLVPTFATQSTYYPPLYTDLLFRAAAGDSGRITRAVETILPLLPVFAKCDGVGAYKVLEKVADIAGQNPALFPSTVSAGIGLSSTLMERDHPVLAESAIELLTHAAGGNPDLLTQAVEAGSTLLPALAKANQLSAYGLLSHLISVSAGNPALMTQVLDAGVATLPTLAEQEVAKGRGFITYSTVQTLTEAGGINAEKGVVCREFMLTEQMGQGRIMNRGLFVFSKDVAETAWAVNGSFVGRVPTVKEYVHAMLDRESTPQPLDIAFWELSRHPSVPSFRDLVRQQKAKPQAPAAA